MLLASRPTTAHWQPALPENTEEIQVRDREDAITILYYGALPRSAARSGYWRLKLPWSLVLAVRQAQALSEADGGFGASAAKPRPYFTRTFFRRNVGTSRSWPSTIVGSLFSKRPRVTGSNCITSCFA